MDSFWFTIAEPLCTPVGIVIGALIAKRGIKLYKQERYEEILLLHTSITSFTMNIGAYSSIFQTEKMYEEEIYNKLLSQYNKEVLINYNKIRSWFPKKHRKILEDYNEYSRNFFIYFGMAVENQTKINDEIQWCKDMTKNTSQPSILYNDMIKDSDKIKENTEEKGKVVYGKPVSTTPSKKDTVAGIATEIKRLETELRPILDKLSKKY